MDLTFLWVLFRMSYKSSTLAWVFGKPKRCIINICLNARTRQNYKD